MIAPLMSQDWGAFVLAVPDKIVLFPWRLLRQWGEGEGRVASPRLRRREGKGSDTRQWGAAPGIEKVVVGIGGEGMAGVGVIFLLL